METQRSANCPACGHELSSYSPPKASSGEEAAARIAGFVAGWGFPAFVLVGVITPVVVLGWISAVLATTAACQGPLILLAQSLASLHQKLDDLSSAS